MKRVMKPDFRTAGLIASTLGLSLMFTGAASATSMKEVGPTTGPVIEVAGLGIKPDTAPVPIVADIPSYPRWALHTEKEGWVVVKLDIDDAGMPKNVEIVERSSSALFDRATLEAVEKFRFKPATYEGEPVAITGKHYKIVYAFQNS